MALPTNRPSNAVPSRRPGGDVSLRAPGEIEYAAVDAIGLERLEAEIHQHLVDEGIITMPTFIEQVGRTVTKRRGDGSHYQEMAGWWATRSQLAVFSFRRELAPTGDNRFKPKGAWRAEGTVHQLPKGITPESSKWNLSASASQDASRPKPSMTHDPLDALPSQLTAPVRGGEAGAFQMWNVMRAEEVIAAYRISEGRVCMLKARRQAATPESLAGTDWAASTIDAPIVSSSAVTITKSPSLGYRTAQAAIPAAESPSHPTSS